MQLFSHYLLATTCSFYLAGLQQHNRELPVEKVIYVKELHQLYTGCPIFIPSIT